MRRGPTNRRRGGAILAVLMACLGLPAAAFGELRPSDVLVVYNSPSPDAQEVLEAYLAAHPDIPRQNLLDLGNPALAGVADIDYAGFAEDIRDPIRRHLMRDERRLTGIKCILLIRGLPHRIEDINYPTLGDRPAEAKVVFRRQGNATYASVDSELALLWQALDRGESGLSMDSYADNVIANPYHGALVGIERAYRGYIDSAKVLDNLGDRAWGSDDAGSYAITSGDFYMVCRIDGQTAEDAIASVRRA